jgi:hypothetical protein
MPQGDLVVANQSGAAFRSDVNAQLLALGTLQSGATAPTPTTYAYQWWANTTDGLLYIRNGSNSAWIVVGTLADTNLGLLSLAGGTLTGALLADDSGTAALPAIAFDGDPNTGIFRAGADQFGIATNGVERVEFGTTEVVFNDGGADVDFRIEGDTEPNLFKIDAGLDQVQVANLNGGQLAGTRNRIINGDMRIDERNNGASVTANEALPVDRWKQNTSGGGVLTSNRSTVAPTGFVNSLLATVSTADASIAAGDFYNLNQRIEGFNVDDFGFGTANAQAVTLSFWARSSATGTFAGCLGNSAANRSYTFTYGISTANTWEYKTVTIPGDTSGTWLVDNGIGIRVAFDLGSGSDFQGTAGAWQSGFKLATAAAVKLISTLNATFYITGVQLEPGTVATPFERRSYGQELALCERYYQLGKAVIIGFGSVGGYVGSPQNYRTTMRTAAPVTLGTPSENVNFSAITPGTTSPGGFRLVGTIGAGTNINAYYTADYSANSEL